MVEAFGLFAVEDICKRLWAHIANYLHSAQLAESVSKTVIKVSSQPTATREEFVNNSRSPLIRCSSTLFSKESEKERRLRKLQWNQEYSPGLIAIFSTVFLSCFFLTYFFSPPTTALIIFSIPTSIAFLTFLFFSVFLCWRSLLLLLFKNVVYRLITPPDVDRCCHFCLGSH